MAYNYSGVSRIIAQSGLLSEQEVAEAVNGAKSAKVGLIRHLEMNGIVETNRLLRTLSKEFSVPILDLAAFNMNYAADAVKMVDEDLIRSEKVLPIFKRGQKLYIAINDPTNVEAVDRIQFKTRQKVVSVLVSVKELDSVVETALGGGFDSMEDDEDSEGLEDLDLEGGTDDASDQQEEEVKGDETPIVKFVNKVLIDAINRGASDIHMEPYEKFYRVRYRIDGMLREVAKPPLNLSTRITARLKVVSNLDISEKRIPQDGRIKLKLSKTKSIDFRVNTCPTLFGEKICMRILDSSSAMLGIDALGYEPEQKEAYLKALANPYGMILVTGPTGSGKTVSLYTGLNILNKPEVNISTAEDPAEINLPGINQVNMNPKAGLDFSKTLRAFLRQDPDVIMVGEIRDLETAGIAIKAAQTGHMVMSTLHTNDAPQTITRLLNMGVPAFNVATSLSLIISQRLARRLCACKESADVPEEVLKEAGFDEDDIRKIESNGIFKAKGCAKCADSGYKGRTGIYQVMPVSDAISRIIMEGGNSIEIADQAHKEGVIDVRRGALNKVMEGLVSLEEANRVTKD